MDVAPSLAFAALLRRYRLARGLSQEALAERAGLSAQAVGALEQGVRRAPYRDTITRLAAALGLSDEARAQLEAAVARGRSQPVPGSAHPGPATGALLALNAPPQHLPPQPTPLIGRDHDLETLRGRLRRADVRLVPLTGPAGAGKTRLAVTAAAGLLDAFEDGVFFVDLAPIRDADVVPSAIAQTLGLREFDEEPPPVRLIDALRDRQLLLLLDNCE